MATNLEKKAEKNIIDSIDKIVANSFLMLLFDGLTLENNPSLDVVLEEPELKKIYDFYIETTLNLRQVVDGVEKTKEQCLRKCLMLKQSLVDVYDVVKIYMSVCNIIDLCIDAYIGRHEEPKSTDSLPEMKKLLTAKVKEFMDEASEHDLEEQACAVLLTVLPIYFDDAELLDYLVKSAKSYFQNSPQQEAIRHVGMLKRNYAPVKMQNYGKYFGKYAAKLSKIFEMLRLSDYEPDLKKLGSDYEKVYSAIEEIADAISALYGNLTYISIVLSSMFTFDDILKNNLIYEDYYAKTIEMLQSPEKDEIMTDASLELIDASIEREMNDLVELTKRKELIYKNVNLESFSENTKALFSMEFYLTTAFYENLEEITDGFTEFSFDEEFTPQPIVKKEIKQLELFIKESSLGMSDVLKEGARRNLFLNVPMASYYDKDKITSYLDMLCRHVKYTHELAPALDTVSKLIDENFLLNLANFEL